MNRYDQFYVAGHFQQTAGNRSITVINPATEQPCAEVLLCSQENADAALLSARRAQAEWRSSSIDERQRVLTSLREALSARSSDIISCLAVEIGCPVWLGERMQVAMGLRGIDLAIEGLSQIAWTEHIGNGVVERVPCGVVAAITPWNFPVHQIVAKVVAAIAAGCSIVLKPSELAPGAAMAFMESVHECGLPAGLVNMVWGDAELGRYLVTHPHVDRISFTGSTAVGRKIMMDAAARLTPLTLELGGKSAAILLDDADLAEAIPVVTRMLLANSGQTCVCQSRLLVPVKRAAEAIGLFMDAAAQWKMGSPVASDTRLGPLANNRQFEHVKSMIARAERQGATPLVVPGSTGKQGYFISPHLFTNVDQRMDLAQQEVFGPVMALMTYETEAQAAAIANSSRYGLSGAVWSADAQRASEFSRNLRTGQVVINGAAQNLATPFGGWGASGFGRENGRFGIEDMLVYRSLHGAAFNTHSA